MKRTILLLLLFVGIKGYSQSSTVGFLPATQEIVLCTDNINTTTSYSPFGLYTIYNPSNMMTNSYLDYFPRTLGANVALYNNGINVGVGVTMEFLPFDEYKIYPDVLIRVHPIKYFTKNPRSADISLMLNISKKTQFGFGVSIPFTLNRL
jgi:hypothetical protein